MTIGDQNASGGRGPGHPDRAPLAETGFLAGICTLDLISSVYLFASGTAVEANPILRPAVEAGLLFFVLAKLMSYIPALLYLERLRERRPQLAERLLRFACVLYPVLYVWGALRAM